MNKGMRRVYLVTTLALLLGGCASYAWIKPDATPEVMARDDASCRAEARDLAGEYAYSDGGAPWGYPPWQQGPMSPYADPSWRATAEQRVYKRCMRGRGYDLVRTDKKR